MTEADDLRERAEDILDRREFRDPEPSLVDRFFGWLGDRIADILEPILSRLGIGGVGAGVAQLIGVTLLLIVIGLLIYAVAKIRRRYEAPVDAVIDTSITVAKSAAQWRADAADHEANRRWALAVRCHYRAAMADLVERRRLVDRPGATSGSWREEAIDGDVDRATVTGLTSTFEGVWYGDVEADSADVEAARRAAEQMAGR